jgi:dihydroflavonol-4-reductase
MEPLDVSPPGLRFLDIERVQADITDADSVHSALGGADVVFHLAARIAITDRDADSVWATNVEGTRNVVAACLRSGVKRLVHISSMNAIAPAPRCAVDEDRPSSVDPSLPVYARSKAAGERAVRRGVEQGLDAVIISPSGMIGPFDFAPSMFGRMLLDLWRGRMPALVEGGVNLVDIRDVVQAMLAAERRGVAGDRYLVGGSWLSLIELAELSATLIGTRVPRFVTPLWLARAAANVATVVTRVTRRPQRLTDQTLIALSQHRLILDTRAMDTLGHRPRRIEETLVETYNWFAESGYLGEVQPLAAIAS